MNEVSHSQMLQALPATFERCFDDTDRLQMVMAPGRVNLLGDHTDYNDGFVLPMTVDRGIYIAHLFGALRRYSRVFTRDVSGAEAGQLVKLHCGRC